VQAVVTLVPTGLPTETAAGGTHTIAVTSTDTLAWTAISDVSWITVTAPTGSVTGNGNVNYTVAASTAPTPARTGHIQVGNQQFTVSQAAGV
jgi:hypothetical protein